MKWSCNVVKEMGHVVHIDRFCYFYVRMIFVFYVKLFCSYSWSETMSIPTVLIGSGH